MGTQKLGQTQGHCKPPGAFDITKEGNNGWSFLVAPSLSVTAECAVGGVVGSSDENQEEGQRFQHP